MGEDKAAKIKVIMMYGYPATGKTFLSKKIAEHFEKKCNVINISTLDFRKELNLFDLKSAEQRNIVYNLVSKKLQNVIKDKSHEIIILDGNFNKRERREKIYSVLKDAEIYIIHCLVSDEKVIKKRLKEREKNIHLYENKAHSMELYNLIKDSADDVSEDGIVKEGFGNIIKFNSERNIIENKGFIKEDNETISGILSVVNELNKLT